MHYKYFYNNFDYNVTSLKHAWLFCKEFNNLYKQHTNIKFTLVLHSKIVPFISLLHVKKVEKYKYNQ